MRILLSVVVLIGLIVLSGCKTKQRAGQRGLEAMKTSELVGKVEANQLDYKTISIKARVEVNTGGSAIPALKATIRMVKDSVIWASLSPGAGIEVARVLITTDSLYMTNRLEKSYVVESMEVLLDRLSVPANLSTAQELLLSGFIHDKPTENRVYKTNNHYPLSESNGSYSLTSEISAEHFTVENLSITDKDSTNFFQVLYSALSKEEGKWLAYNRKISVRGKQKMTADVLFNRVDINKPVNTSFKINKKYKRRGLFPSK